MFTFTFDNIEKYKCNVAVSHDKNCFQMVNYTPKKKKKKSHII